VVLPGLIPMIACLPFVRSTKFVKARLRRQVAQARKSIDPELRSESSVLASARLCDLIIESAAPADGFVAVYSAVGSELSLDSLAVLLGAAGYRVAYPAILGEGHMEFYTPFGSDALDLDSLAVIADPMATWAEDDLSGLTPVAADELSVVVVPGVAFDYDCHRMGFGGGFYDRYLPRLNADSLAFGVCFDEQMVAALPVERHDQRLDAVVTPTACHQGSPSMIDQIKQRLNKEEQG
jgi:5-formyltetrahydrofolate cyclo-ligase